jgi:flagellar basal-body rod protein FlgB
MTLEEMPLFAMLRGKLGFLNERQRVVSENVANANTPGYTPSDLKPFTIDQALRQPGQMVSTSMGTSRTNAGHLAGRQVTKSTWKSDAVADSETTLDGNSVVLEDQMVKMSEARLDYDAAISLYQKSIGLIRLASRRPGGGA